MRIKRRYVSLSKAFNGKAFLATKGMDARRRCCWILQGSQIGRYNSLLMPIDTSVSWSEPVDRSVSYCIVLLLNSWIWQFLCCEDLKNDTYITWIVNWCWSIARDATMCCPMYSRNWFLSDSLAMPGRREHLWSWWRSNQTERHVMLSGQHIKAVVNWYPSISISIPCCPGGAFAVAAAAAAAWCSKMLPLWTCTALEGICW